LPDIESVLGRLQGIINRAKASSLIGVEQKTLFNERIDAHFSELSVRVGWVGAKRHHLSINTVVVGFVSLYPPYITTLLNRGEKYVRELSFHFWWV
jgi:hypothetical protein